MHRIDGDGHDNNLFTEGDPHAQIPRTLVTKDWLNDVQEIIMAVIEDAGTGNTKGRDGDNDLLNAIKTIVGVEFMPAGTKMAFFQAAAPVGWTQDVSQNDKMLRVVSGAGAGSGGGWTISGLTHAVPNHKHATAYSKRSGVGNILAGRNGSPWGQVDATTMGLGAQETDHADVFIDPADNPPYDKTSEQIDDSTGNVTSDGAWRPAYVDIIICTKD